MSDVVATRFVLKDSSGKNRATLEVVNDQTVLTLLNKQGKRIATLSEAGETSGLLYLYGGRTNAFMAIHAEGGNPTVFIFDENGKTATLTSSGVHTLIADALEDLPKIPGALTPTITSLEPSSVPQGWAGKVRIHGTGFDNGSFALFDGTVPRTLFKTETLLEAEVDAGITGTSGTKTVKVHTAGGGLSNEVKFVVQRAS